MIGDYWITDIDKQTYCFKIEDSRIITYKETAARSCRILFYSTKHYLPISPEDTKNLGETLRLNNLPRMNMMMFGLFKILSQREKKHNGEAFKEHNLEEVVKTVSGGGQKYALQATNLQTYFENLACYKIITPVREVTEFVEDDLIATDPKFLGDIYNAIQRTDHEHKKVTNAKVDAKKNWVLIMAIAAIICAIGAMGFYLITNGNIQLPFQLPSQQPNQAVSPNAAPLPGQKMTDAQVFQRYPTPDDLHRAIQNGDIQMNQLSPKVQDMVKSYKPSQAAAH